MVKDIVYLLAGWSERDEELLSVYTCQLSKLIGTLNTLFSQVWSQVRVAPCPVAQTTCITFHNKLLIMGGTVPDDPKKTPVDAIHIYKSTHIAGILYATYQPHVTFAMPRTYASAVFLLLEDAKTLHQPVTMCIFLN